MADFSCPAPTFPLMPLGFPFLHALIGDPSSPDPISPPIGDLHKIAIENVPDEYGISIGDKYNVYRVKSTK